MMYVGVFNPLKKPKGMAGDLFYWKARIRYILRFTPQEKPKWTIVDNFVVLDVVVVVLFFLLVFWNSEIRYDWVFTLLKILK